MTVILDQTKIGEHMSVGVEAEDDEIGLIVASEDVSSSIAFIEDEWDNFVQAVNEADERMKS